MAPAAANPPAFITDPRMQQVLVQIQFTGNFSNAPIAIDHQMCGLDPVLRGIRTPRS